MMTLILIEVMLGCRDFLFCDVHAFMLFASAVAVFQNYPNPFCLPSFHDFPGSGQVVESDRRSPGRGLIMIEAQIVSTAGHTFALKDQHTLKNMISAAPNSTDHNDARLTDQESADHKMQD